ncbi:MAG: hypothetical protein J0L92_32750 [Deltaproteobacteria bacterium]|nr:hypothetical protein [Deltaproteobacteria bacterium]
MLSSEASENVCGESSGEVSGARSEVGQRRAPRSPVPSCIEDAPDTIDEVFEALRELMPSAPERGRFPREALSSAAVVLGAYVPCTTLAEGTTIDDVALAIGGLFVRLQAHGARDWGTPSTLDDARSVSDVIDWTETRPATSLERFARLWLAAHVELATPLDTAEHLPEEHRAEATRMEAQQHRTRAAQLFALATEALADVDAEGMRSASYYVLSAIAGAFHP